MYWLLQVVVVVDHMLECGTPNLMKIARDTDCEAMKFMTYLFVSFSFVAWG